MKATNQKQAKRARGCRITSRGVPDPLARNIFAGDWQSVELGPLNPGVKWGYMGYMGFNGFNGSRMLSNPAFKKGTLFCLKGFLREPQPPQKGIRVLLGILGVQWVPLAPQSSTLDWMSESVRRLM